MSEGDHSAGSLLLDDQVVLDRGYSIDSTLYSSPFLYSDPALA